MADPVSISSVRFRNLKGLRDFSLKLRHMNVLVGPNNSGKSTVVGAFRALAVLLRKARSRSPASVNMGCRGRRLGYAAAATEIPISLENVHTDYADEESTVTFLLTNANQLHLFFPQSGGCQMCLETAHRQPRSPAEFRGLVSLTVGVVPVLGPVEHNEPLLQEKTVQSALGTHRASRHFRNYWYHNPESFDRFRELLSRTWRDMDIRRPEIVMTNDGPTLTMFCREARIDRELYWIGSGFQIWCQLLSHIIRAEADTLLLVDEPEIYLHPDMQRQLLGIFRNAGPDVLLATHSSELIGEAEAADIVLINKDHRSAQRLRNVEQLQDALDYLGSGHNNTLAQLARTRRVLFVEGDDFRLLRRFAERLGLKELASGLDIVPVPVGGFGQWTKVRALGWGIHRTIGRPMLLGAVFDRDYFCFEEIASIGAQLRTYLAFVAIHERKELENYLLIPETLERCLEKALKEQEQRSGQTIAKSSTVTELLIDITGSMKTDVSAERSAKASEFNRRERTGINDSDIGRKILRQIDEKWPDLRERLCIVPGKDTLSKLNGRLQELYHVSFTPSAIINQMRRDEVPADLRALIDDLEKFRLTLPPERCMEVNGTDNELP